MTTSIRKMLVIDGLGALLTATLIFFVLIPFQSWIGLSTDLLEILSQLASIFGFYSFTIFFLFKNPPVLFLKIISILNLGYCLFTLVLMLIFRNTVQWLGWVYFVGEIVVILILVKWEWIVIRNSRELNKANKN